MKTINTITLSNILGAHLPEPDRVGQRYVVEAPSRLADLDREYAYLAPIQEMGEVCDKTYTFDTFIFEAKQFCVAGKGCWLEWELVVEPETETEIKEVMPFWGMLALAGLTALSLYLTTVLATLTN